MNPSHDLSYILCAPYAWSLQDQMQTVQFLWDAWRWWHSSLIILLSRGIKGKVLGCFILSSLLQFWASARQICTLYKFWPVRTRLNKSIPDAYFESHTHLIWNWQADTILCKQQFKVYASDRVSSWMPKVNQTMSSNIKNGESSKKWKWGKRLWDGGLKKDNKIFQLTHPVWWLAMFQV